MAVHRRRLRRLGLQLPRRLPRLGIIPIALILMASLSAQAEPTFDRSPASGPPGTDISVSGICSNDEVRMYLQRVSDDGVVNAEQYSVTDGVWGGSISVPSGTSSEDYELRADCRAKTDPSKNYSYASQPFKVTDSDPSPSEISQSDSFNITSVEPPGASPGKIVKISGTISKYCAHGTVEVGFDPDPLEQWGQNNSSDPRDGDEVVVLQPDNVAPGGAFEGSFVVPDVGVLVPRLYLICLNEEGGLVGWESRPWRSDDDSGGATKARDEPSGRPPFTRAINTPRDVNWSPKVVGTNLLLAVLLVILMPFPAALFNSTLGANYEAVRRWFRLKPKPPDAPTATPPKRWLAFGALIILTALLNSVLDPSLGLDRRSLTFFLGLVASIAAVNLVGSIPDRLYMRIKYKDRPVVTLFPLALLVTVACVGISRLVEYRPGYLYGLIAGMGFSKAMSEKESGWATLRTTVWMFVVSGLAWLAWVPVKAAVEASPDQLELLVLDTTLAALFAAGIAGNMFGLLPLKFLGGEKLLRWNRVAWGLLFGFGVFTFLQTLIEHIGDAIPRSSIVTAASLFVGFGAVSVAFWGYFRIKNRKAASTTP